MNSGESGSVPAWRVALERVLRDLELAIRGLRRSPGFAVAAIAILGLGIGMSTAMFTIYRAVLVDRLPVADQDRLIIMHPLDRGGSHLDPPLPFLKEMRRDSGTIRAVAGVYHIGALPAALLDGTTSFALAEGIITPNLFDVLGARPFLGRFIRPADGDAGAPGVLVLTFQTWHRLFNADRGIIGHTFVVPYDRSRLTVVGVAPPGLEYPAGVEAWVAAKPDFTAQVDVLARLAPGATIEAARSTFYALLQRVNPFAGETLPDLPKISGIEAHSFTQELLGSARPAITILTLAVVLLLVIACVNVGNLVLVRTTARTREIAVRRAIGASYGDITHQLVVENAVIGVVGGGAGLLCAQLLLRVLLAFAPAQLPRTDVLRLGGAPAGVALGVTAVAVLLFGLFPAFVAARAAPYGVLRSDTRSGSEAPSGRRTRRWLVSSQMALALIMLAGAALLARSLDRLLRMDLGYQPHHVSLLSVTGPQSVFSSADKNVEVAERLMTRLRAVPGLESVTPIESVPFKGQSFFIMKMARADQPASERANSPFIPFDIGGEEYFQTLQIPIIRGRGFLKTDTKEGEKVVVLSEALAHRFWPNDDAVGKQLRNVYDTTNTVWTVVGIARDTHFRSLRDVAPVIYVPFAQLWTAWWSGQLAVRTRGPLSGLLPSMRSAVRDVDPGIVIWKTDTMDQLLDGPLAQPRLSALLLSSFSVVALLLAAIGLYGVMSSLVRQRTREIGVRIALGATARDVRTLVLGEALRVVALGAGIGLAGALLGTRLLSSLLFGVRPTDPAALLGSCALLVAIGVCAAYVPARHAGRIDPARALRAE
jgi:putative ABC transport system permease protein